MSKVYLSLLGAPRIRRGGHAIPYRTAKGIALLAYLASTGGSQSRDHVTDLLWPESLPDAARKNLRNTLWSLRSELGDGVVAAEGEMLTLGEVTSDVGTFDGSLDRLDRGNEAAGLEALELYRGPFLDGLVVQEAPEFELWMTRERERLARRATQARERLVGLRRAAGDWEAAVRHARDALRDDPLNEPLVRELMRVLAEQGDRAEALRQYDALSRALRRELGVEPLPESRALRDAIRDGRHVPMPGHAPPTRRRDHPHAPALRPLVARQEEVAALDQALHLAVSTGPRAMWITGELGIGKSRLLEAWGERLSGDTTLLRMRCLDTTRALPFAPLATLLRESSALAPLWERSSPLAPLWRAVLTRLVPERHERAETLPTLPLLPEGEERYRLFEALVHAVESLAAGPIVIQVDDAHWIDRATLDWLVYLVDRLPSHPILIVAAYRPADAPAHLLHVVALWNREGRADSLALRPLYRHESEALLATLPEQPVIEAARLHRESGGNPFFLLELARAGDDETPRALEQLIQARLTRLGEVVVQVTQAASILPGRLTVDMLQRVSGRSEEEVVDAVDRLLEAELFGEHLDHYHFSHPFVARVVRNALSVARRSFLHRRAAEAVEALSTGPLGAIAGQLAYHHANAGRPKLAAGFAELAGERALELFAAAEAEGHFREALQLEPTPARRRGLAQALVLAGRLDEGRDELTVALGEAEAAGEHALAASIALQLGQSYLPSAEGVQVTHWARRALENDTALDRELRARAYLVLGAGTLMSEQRLDAAAPALERANELVDPENAPALAAECRFQLGNLHAQQGDFAAALERYEQAIALAEQGGARVFAVIAHNNLAYHALLAGETALAGAHNEKSIDLAHDLGLVTPWQYLESTRGEIALAAGRLDEAEEAFERALEAAERVQNRIQAANTRANLAQLARRHGELDIALDQLDQAHEMVAGARSPHLQSQIDLWLAELHLERGERKAARDALDRALKRLEDSGRDELLRQATAIGARLADGE